MGRQSDYERMRINQDKSKEKIIENELNKKTIGTDELGKIVGKDPRHITNLLNEFCKENGLSVEDFKDGQKYSFKPEWNGILTVLLSLTAFPKNREKYRPQVLTEFYDQSKALIKWIDDYLTEDDQNLVKENACYNELRATNEMYHLLTKRITAIIVSLGMLPDCLKIQTLAHFNEVIETIPCQLNQKYVSWLMDDDLREKRLKQNEDSKELALNNDSVEALLISILKMRLNNVEIPNTIYSERDFIETILKMSSMYNLSWPDEKMNEMIKTSREEYLSIKEISQVLNKVKLVLDSENLFENHVLTWIENLLRTFALTQTLTAKNIDLGEELLRQALANEGMRVLNNKTDPKIIKELNKMKP